MNIEDFDENGFYIDKNIDKIQKVNNDNKIFVSDLTIFLKKHNIKGSANTYGFSTTCKDSAIKILDSLNFKYRLDFTNQWNVKFIISKKYFYSFNKI